MLTKADGDTIGVAWLSKHSDSLLYRYRTGSNWSSPYTLATSGSSNGLSCPRMALDNADTAHLAYAAKAGSDLKLFHVKFPLTDPGTPAPESVARWTPSGQLGNIDSLGGSITVDYERRPYLAWVENTTVKAAGAFNGSFVTKTVATTSTADAPLTIIENLPMGYNFGIAFRSGGTLMRSYRYIKDSTEIFRDTTYSGSSLQALAGKGAFSVCAEGGRIFCTAWNAIDRTWSAPETLNTDTLSNYPQIEAEQFTDGSSTRTPCRYVIWTERCDSVYRIACSPKTYEDNGETGVSPYAYLKMGTTPATPFTAYRAGTKSYGAEEYKKIDYADQPFSPLVYRLPCLGDNRQYRQYFERYFFQSMPMSPWTVRLKENGNQGALDSLYSGQLRQDTSFISAAVTGQDSLRIEEVKITSDQSAFAPLSRIIVYGLRDTSGGAPLRVGGIEERGVLPAVFRLYHGVPNPASTRAVIRYEIPIACHVQLCVYDATGRIVTQLVDQNRAPGSYVATFGDQDFSGRRPPSGVYFCRMEARDETSKLLFRSPQKLVLMR